MKQNNALVNLAMVSILIFCAGFACGPSSDSDGGPSGTRDTSSGPASTDTGDLAGTYWSIQLDSGNSGPDMEFCSNGTWGMLHYGGQRESGPYRLGRGRLVLTNEDGSAFGNYRLSRTGDNMTLDSGSAVMRLRYIHRAGC